MSVSTSILDDAGATEALVKAYLGGDEHENAEPIHDDARNIDADDWNKIVAGLSELAKRLRPGNIVAIDFELSSTPGSTTTAVPLCGSALTGWLAFKDATLVGLTARFETALTGGQATIQPEIGGVDSALSLVIASTDQAGRAYQLPGAADAADQIDASALELLEVDVTTDGSFACSGSSKLHVTAFVSIGEEEDI